MYSYLTLAAKSSGCVSKWEKERNKAITECIHTFSAYPRDKGGTFSCALRAKKNGITFAGWPKNVTTTHWRNMCPILSMQSSPGDYSKNARHNPPRPSHNLKTLDSSPLPTGNPASKNHDVDQVVSQKCHRGK